MKKFVTILFSVMIVVLAMVTQSTNLDSGNSNKAYASSGYINLPAKVYNSYQVGAPAKIIEENTVVTIEDAYGNYYLITDNQNTRGWVNKNFVSYYNSENYVPDLPLSFKQQDMIKELIRKFNLGTDEYFIYSLIYIESRYRPNAESCSGAKGMMQIMPNTFKYLYKTVNTKYPELSGGLVNDIYDVNTNIILGMYYLKELKDIYAEVNKISDNYDKVLTMYNMGPAGAMSYYSSTGTYSSQYSRNILRARHCLMRDGNWRNFK